MHLALLKFHFFSFGFISPGNGLVQSKICWYLLLRPTLTPFHVHALILMLRYLVHFVCLLECWLAYVSIRTWPFALFHSFTAYVGALCFSLPLLSSKSPSFPSLFLYADMSYIRSRGRQIKKGNPPIPGPQMVAAQLSSAQSHIH